MRKTTKTTLLSAAFMLCGSLSTMAQSYVERPRSINFQLLGSNNGVGFNYDARFKKGSAWGYRAGLGFGYTKSEWFFGVSESTRIYSVPLGINYLIGKRKSNLELGVGVNLGIYNDHSSVATSVGGGSYAWQTESENNFDSFAFFDVGYRHTARKGFQFRVGLTLATILTNNRDYSNRTALQPYISFGKAF